MTRLWERPLKRCLSKRAMRSEMIRGSGTDAIESPELLAWPSSLVGACDGRSCRLDLSLGKWPEYVSTKCWHLRHTLEPLQAVPSWVHIFSVLQKERERERERERPRLPHTSVG